MQYVVWFRELANMRASWARDLKYGELYVEGFPVPSGFVIIPEAREFISRATEVADVSQLSPSSIPETLRKKIVDCYFSLDSGIDYDALTADAKALVNAARRAGLVRVKSRTKEFTNIRGSGIILEAVLKCLAAGGPVVVQKMVRAEKSGTASARGDRITVNSTYGELKHLLNKEVVPDVFYVSKYDGRVQDKRRGSKEFALIVDDGGTEKRISVPAERRESFSLHQKELEIVHKLATRVEQKYPGKTAYWGISGRKVYLLGLSEKEPEVKTAEPVSATAFAPSYGEPARSTAFHGERRAPSTDIFSTEPAKPKEEKPFFSDFGGLASTPTPQPSPSDTPSWRSSVPQTSSADSTRWQSSEPSSQFADTTTASRPFEQKPKVSRESNAFGNLFDSDFGTSSASSSDAVRTYEPENKGSVFAPAQQEKKSDVFSTTNDIFSTTSSFEPSKPEPPKDIFSTGFEETKPAGSGDVFSTGLGEVKESGSVFSTPSAGQKVGVFIDGPAGAEQLVSQNPDVVFLNIEKFLPAQSYGYNPQASFDELARNVFSTLKTFSGKDANIVLRRVDSQALEMEFAAIGKAINETQRSGLSLGKINILLPFVTSVSEVKKAEDLIIKHGLHGKVDLGVVVETPAAASIIEEICERCGFVAVNMDNLAQYMLAVDKNDEKIKHLHTYAHGAVSNALKSVAKACNRRSVPVHAFGEAIENPEVVKLLKEQEFSGVVASQNNFSSLKSSMSGAGKSGSSWDEPTTSSYW